MGELFDGEGQLRVGLGQLDLIAFDLCEQILARLLQEDRGARRLADAWSGSPSSAAA